MYPPDRIDDYRRRAQQNAIANALRPPRQPWDERTPGGQTVQELMREGMPQIRPRVPTDLMNRIESPLARIRSGNVPDAALQAPQAAAQPSPRIAISSQPATGITGTLNLPQPTAEAQPMLDAPQPNQPITGPAASPVLGPSIRGMGRLDRDIALRDAMSNADPESRVRIAGDEIDISPPGMKGVGRRGRFATAGEAALNALGSGDPDRPLYSLGQGIGAGVTGLVSPRAGAKINRRFDISRLDNDIARGIQLETAKSGLASAEALRRQREIGPILDAQKLESDIEYRNAQLELDRQKAAGVIDQRTYEKERDRLDRESRERVAGRSRRDDDYADQKSEYEWQTKNAENEGKRAAVTEQISAMEATANDHLTKRRAADEEISRLTKERNALTITREEKQEDGTTKSVTVKASDKDSRVVPILERIEKLKKESEYRQKEADDAFKKRDTLKGEASKYPTLPPPPKRVSAAPPAPPGVTEASVRAEAKKRGADEEAAVRKARGFGWIP